MDRKSFIRNLFMSTAVSLMPKVLWPAEAEVEDYPFHISGKDVPFEPPELYGNYEISKIILWQWDGTSLQQKTITHDRL